jgi:hypothetical protein
MTAVAETILPTSTRRPVDFKENFDGQTTEPEFLPSGGAQPAGQRGLGDRCRDGDEHPAAQPR